MAELIRSGGTMGEIRPGVAFAFSRVASVRRADTRQIVACIVPKWQLPIP